MTDPIDDASELEALQREDALQAQRLRAASQLNPDGISSWSCAVCGEPIPAERRQVMPGVRTCRYCQAELEAAQHGLNGGHQ